MPKLDQFHIEFSQPNAVFYAGQQVTGRVCVSVFETISCRCIDLEIRGFAKTHWSETVTTGSGEDQKQETVYYDGRQEYLRQDVLLYGTGMSSGDLPAGFHEFAFSFILPQTCATSFEGKNYGHIRYQCTATIRRPWKFNHTAKAPFTVVSPVDLNYHPTAANPMQHHRTKTLGVLCCKAGELHANVNLATTGFVPGEQLPLKIYINNDSSRRVKRVKVELEQVVTFRAGNHGYTTCPDNYCDDLQHQQVEHNKVAQLSFPGMEENEHREYNPDQMPKIPALPASLSANSIITIDYVVHVEIDPSGMSTDLDIRMPIVIGTVPLRQVFYGADYPSQTPAAVQQPHSILPYNQEMMSGGGPIYPQAEQKGYPPPPAAGASAYPRPPQVHGGPSKLPTAPPAFPADLPPPTYEESFFGRSNIRDHNDNEHVRCVNEWAPMYPVYGFNSNIVNPAQ